MTTDLQKASAWKRIAAGIFDLILLCVLAVGCIWMLTAALGYDGYNASLEQAYADYETRYGVEFRITQAQYEAMSQQQKENYDAAYAALIADEQVLYTYNMLINLAMISSTFGILLAVVVLEFAVPLWLKNGQTVGKKIFAIGLMRTDGVRMNNIQLFTRTVLGKFTIEIMIPVYIVIMICLDSIGVVGPLVLGLIGLVQLICVVVTRTNSLIHDLLAGTVAVDISSQMIFDTTDDLIAYQKKIAAEQAARQVY
jgi:uncharacterized RDD family membrane protein YckC